MNKTFTFGKLMVTTTTQSCGSPLIDTAFSSEREGLKRRWKGWAILLAPWRRNKHGESLPQRALVVGWQQGTR